MLKTTPVKCMTQSCFLSFLGLVLCLPLWLAKPSHAIEVVPQTADFYVNDAAGLLSQKTRKYIIDTNVALNKASGAQVVVVTVPDMGGAALEEYATTLFNQYGIGDKLKNNGLLLLLALKERKFRIEVGYGLEGVLNDSKTGRIQDVYMIPHFKKGEWDTGIRNGFNALVQEIQKEYGISVVASAPVSMKTPAKIDSEPEENNEKKERDTLFGWIFIIYSLVWTIVTFWRVLVQDDLAGWGKAMLCYGVGGWIILSLILYYGYNGDLDATDSLGISAFGGIFILLLLLFGIKELLFGLFGLKSGGLHGGSSSGSRSFRGGGGRSGGGGSSRGF